MRYALTLWLLMAGPAMAQDFVITERWDPPAAAVQVKRVVQPKRVARVTMRWNIRGDWSPSEAQTRQHLQSEHGVSTAGMTHQQMLSLHDSLHDGRSSGTIRMQSAGGCPGGVCPPRRRASGVRLFARGW